MSTLRRPVVPEHLLVVAAYIYVDAARRQHVSRMRPCVTTQITVVNSPKYLKEAVANLSRCQLLALDLEVDLRLLCGRAVDGPLTRL